MNIFLASFQTLRPCWPALWCGLLCLSWIGSATLADELPAVIVASATHVEFPLTVEAIGTARANEAVEIRPKITETITAIEFKEGQDVVKGQVLVRLEDAEARAAVAAARAALVDSESKYKRNQELAQSDLVSESQVETAEAQRDAHRAALDAAQARLENTVMRAPFSGRVGLRRVSLGSLVSSATVVTTLDDTETIKLDFDVPETVLSHLSAGLPVIARSAAWPDATFEGLVSAVDTRVDPASRTVTVRAALPNPRLLLRPGMFLTVELLRRDVSAVMVPEQSLVPEQSRQYVFVVGEDNVVSRREVRVGRRRPGQAEIVEGLRAGEVVVTEGTQKIRAGTSVRIVGQLEVTQ